MRFTYESQGTNTFLVYQLTGEDVLDSMSMGMLTNNKISGLVTTIFIQMNNERYIKYNVSSKVSVKHFFSGAVTKKRLLGVFKGIVNALLSAEEYMIDENTILLDLDYMFAEVSSCETVLVCLPVQGMEEKHDLNAFFKKIMFSTQFDQTENCDYVARIINYLNGVPSFSLSDFRDLLEQIEKGEYQSTNTAAQQPVLQAEGKNMLSQPAVSATVPRQDTVLKKSNSSTVREPEMSAESRQQAAQPSAGDEKKITMLGLLTHYSRENAKLYKEQKAAKKSGGTADSKNKMSEKKRMHVDFKVPGAETQAAVSGQATVNREEKQTEQQSTMQIEQSSVNGSMTQSAINSQVSAKKNFGQTTVLTNKVAGETTVLSAGLNPMRKPEPYLIRAKNNEKIPLSKPVFRVGKERSYVDYFVADNTAVSRSHADFITRDGKYYVVDTNSTNHTYVNGQMILSNMEVELVHGTRVRLANEDFEFRTC